MDNKTDYLKIPIAQAVGLPAEEWNAWVENNLRSLDGAELAWLDKWAEDVKENAREALIMGGNKLVEFRHAHYLGYMAGFTTAREQYQKQARDSYNLCVEWQRLAEGYQAEKKKAEDMIQHIIDTLRKEMIWKPIDNWQWGFRSALLRILDVIHPDKPGENA